MFEKAYVTNTRDELIMLSTSFAEALKPVIVANQQPCAVFIEGDRASGKSLVSDVVTCHLLGIPLTAPKWKHLETNNGEIGGLPFSISFVNKNGDGAGVVESLAIKARPHSRGLIFISNPRTSNFKSRHQRYAPVAHVNVKFAESARKPLQFGPFKLRSGTFERKTTIQMLASPHYVVRIPRTFAVG